MLAVSCFRSADPYASGGGILAGSRSINPARSSENEITELEIDQASDLDLEIGSKVSITADGDLEDRDAR
jgi:hypothetical protein